MDHFSILRLIAELRRRHGELADTQARLQERREAAWGEPSIF